MARGKLAGYDDRYAYDNAKAESSREIRCRWRFADCPLYAPIYNARGAARE